MYQREAMWMSFNSASPKESYAVKISVGGVNALTGSRKMRAHVGSKIIFRSVARAVNCKFYVSSSVVLHSRRDAST